MFPTISRQVRSELVELIGVDPENNRKIYTIRELKEGSIVLTFNLAVPDGQNPEEAYKNVQEGLKEASLIGGVPLISVKKLKLIDPTKPDVQTKQTVPDV